MKHETLVTWHSGMSFDVALDGHHFAVDAAPEHGGKGKGPKPKGLLLSGLAGCTGMDVVSILNKMKMPYDTFALGVEGELSEGHPLVYERIKIVYTFTGRDLDRAKIEKAVGMSLDKYCGVAAMLGRISELTHEIRLNP